MQYRIHLFFVSVCLCLTVGLVCGQSVKKNPLPIIFDTDMGPDYDDVGAITLLHAFADEGEAEILATIASTNYPKVAQVLNVLNTYFNRPNIPIGVPKGKAVSDKDSQHWSDSITYRYPHRIMSNIDVPDAVTLYRQTLAKQPDRSVTIITVGFLTNLANLLQSKPDQYSKLTGKELVTKKVKQVISMAGKFPNGREYNVHRDTLSSQVVFSDWPTPIVCSGFEIGEKILSGLPLARNTSIQNSPVKDAFTISLPKSKQDVNGRMSWDQTAVLVGVKGYEPYYTIKSGRMIVKADGSNDWDDSGAGHYYLIEKMPVKDVETLINTLMQHQPKAR